ncbi:hypothetical protein BUALT_Bualt05G0154800 [Buddleja alternifolia]|uniref:Uncharacterized protein n=1 Tax=Buddleja alternifolia TaxID=168488 RepID=A0AAV6XJH0_9LAMI|nr:hypothetical protein BUALT_Bualt05G0154800 [Buddleja alternifolia]
MASRFIAYLACIVALAAIAAAHDGHHHAPAPAPASGAFTSSPSAAVGLLAVVVSFFAVIPDKVMKNVKRMISLYWL